MAPGIRAGSQTRFPKGAHYDFPETEACIVLKLAHVIELVGCEPRAGADRAR